MENERIYRCLKRAMGLSNHAADVLFRGRFDPGRTGGLKCSGKI